jgi:hypothetical protein
MSQLTPEQKFTVLAFMKRYRQIRYCDVAQEFSRRYKAVITRRECQLLYSS